MRLVLAGWVMGGWAVRIGSSLLASFSNYRLICWPDLAPGLGGPWDDIPVIARWRHRTLGDNTPSHPTQSDSGQTGAAPCQDSECFPGSVLSLCNKHPTIPPLVQGHRSLPGWAVCCSYLILPVIEIIYNSSSYFAANRWHAMPGWGWGRGRPD